MDPLDVLVSIPVDQAVREAVEEVAHRFEAAGKITAPKGTPGNSTNDPGDLARSILVDGPVPVAEGVWEASVGPTIIYARQRELGGPLPHGAPRLMHFKKFGEDVYTMHVGQEGAHYMREAYVAVLPTIEGVVRDRIAAALMGL